MQSVYFVTTNEALRYVRRPGYRVLNNKTGPWLRRFLIRKMWSWLHNCGALEQYFTEHETYEFTRDQQREILDRVMVNIRAVYERGEDISEHAILCGAKDFMEITSAAVTQHMPIQTTVSLDTARQTTEGFVYRGRHQGLLVHVVPNMEGIILVPKVAIEKR